ncbi:MAG: aldehyde dehydrogenase family protein, partial [Planctomycetes bacterium]|nr:aldehyde dehydrogenase family protein [Planctomycetota bacterium]
WNTALAIVCGDTVVWKPSEKTPVTALACLQLFNAVAAEFSDAPAHLCQVVTGDAQTGMALVDDPRIPLVSATGSTAMGRAVAPRVAGRFGRTILELGGNNAIIVAPSADPSLALPAIVFGAVGTAGQRCTSTRRLFVHNSLYDELVPAIRTAYERVRIGDPLAKGTLVG